MLKLVGTDGKRFYSWELKPGKYIVGRKITSGKSACDFAIQDKTVSKNHAEIVVDAGGFHLADNGSKNGTLVNGEMITGSVSVKEGDKIMFGQAEFKLTHQDKKSSDASPVPTTTRLADKDLGNSVFLSINEALQPLPTKATERPELVSTLFEMAKLLSLPEPKEIMLERSLGLIARVIPAERLAVLSVAEDQSEIYTDAALLPHGKDPGAFTLSRTIVNEIITNKNAILICDPLTDPRFAEQKSIIMSELKSAVAVPLFDEGRVLGILYADTTSPAHRYDDEHLRVLATFGNLIASRLLNYELMNERQEKQVIEAELRRASSIQKGLLVTDPPEHPGYEIMAFQEQSRSVGGDLYDLCTLPDGRLLFCVADVSGKGMGAALLMSNILASFRILYEFEDFDLCRAVSRVSLQMNKYSQMGDFATLFIGIADSNSGRITYVNAGHNPPVVVRSDGRIEHLDATGFMIGAFDFGDWTEGKLDLADEDLLYIFTDGVTEAQQFESNDDDEGAVDQYGEERLERLLKESRRLNPGEIVDCIMKDISDFVGDAPQSDDITMLVLKKVSS